MSSTGLWVLAAILFFVAALAFSAVLRRSRSTEQDPERRQVGRAQRVEQGRYRRSDVGIFATDFGGGGYGDSAGHCGFGGFDGGGGGFGGGDGGGSC